MAVDTLKVKSSILISMDFWECRAVLLEGGKIVEFYAERRSSRLPVNSIFLGKVKDFSPALNSYFVNIGLTKNAFLSLDDSFYSFGETRHSLKKGDEVIVQLIKPPQKTKGARVTMSISIPGHYIVYFPLAREKFINVSRKISDEVAAEIRSILLEKISENCGIIVRTAALDADLQTIFKEFAYLKEKWASIKHLAQKKSAPALIFTDDPFAVRVIREAYRENVEEILVDSENAYREILSYAEKFIPGVKDKLKLYTGEKPLFEQFKVENELKEVFSRTVSLPSGGYIVIDKREALTVIDVNSGRFKESKNHEAMAYQVNIEAVQEVSRQLRLRNISGIVVVDFVDMKSEEAKRELLNRFSEAIEEDRASTFFEFVPSMSMLIITRKHMSNVSTSFYEEECACCHGSGWTISKSALAAYVLRGIRKELKKKSAESVVFLVNDKILETIKSEMLDTIEELEKESSKNVYLVGVSNLDFEEYEVALIGSDELVKRHFPNKIMFTK